MGFCEDQAEEHVATLSDTRLTEIAEDAVYKEWGARLNGHECYCDLWHDVYFSEYYRRFDTDLWELVELQKVVHTNVVNAALA